MTTVNVHDAKTHFSRLLERAHRGEEITLAKAGVPYARLVPLPPPATRTPGGLTGTWDVDVFEASLPDDEIEAWEGA